MIYYKVTGIDKETNMYVTVVYKLKRAAKAFANLLRDAHILEIKR